MRTILEAGKALRAREVSSRELTQTMLGRIERLNPQLNAFLTVTSERAMADAGRADAELAAGQDRGPLHGIPIALKDVYCTKGIRTTVGSRLFADHVPDVESAVGEKLAAAGAVLLGKTHMHELAYGVTSNNPHFGAVRNPWGLDRVPGGSSGGSGAAVAARMTYMAMGSDTGGSIRVPAAFCNTVGLKPTHGRVSRFGVMPLDFTLDHMGPLTLTVRDAAVCLQAMAGPDPRDQTSSGRAVDNYLPADRVNVKHLRIGVPANHYFDRLDPAVAAAVGAMIELAGKLCASVETVRVPDVDALNTVGRVILMAEASSAMERYFDRFDEIGADVRMLLEQGRLLSAVDYINAQRLRRQMRDEFLAVFEDVDLLLTPVTPTGAGRIGERTVSIQGVPEDFRLATTRLVRGINVLGIPALSLPCGFDADGMPVGLQIIGKPFAEAAVLAAGAALEDETGFWERRPELGDTGK